MNSFEICHFKYYHLYYISQLLLANERIWNMSHIRIKLSPNVTSINSETLLLVKQSVYQYLTNVHFSVALTVCRQGMSDHLRQPCGFLQNLSCESSHSSQAKNAELMVSDYVEKQCFVAENFFIKQCYCVLCISCIFYRHYYDALLSEQPMKTFNVLFL